MNRAVYHYAGLSMASVNLLRANANRYRAEAADHLAKGDNFRAAIMDKAAAENDNWANEDEAIIKEHAL